MYKLPGNMHLLPDSQNARDKSLRCQEDLFIDRYHRSSWSFVFTVMAFVLYAVGSALSGGLPPKQVQTSDLLLDIAGVVAIIATISFFVGLGLLIREFLSGIKTLNMNRKSVPKNLPQIRTPADKSDNSGSQDGV